jgi:riboflavin kinase/FMN adenylyltransferase
MRIFRHFNDLPGETRDAAIAVGNFDGVHRGHQAVIAEAGRIARDAGSQWGVLTFEPHPRRVFKPDTEPFRLTPFRLKVRHLEAMGVDFLVVLRFDQAFSRRVAESFVEEILVSGLAAHHVVSGYDFAFGHGRRGDSELLLGMGRQLGFGFTCVTALSDEAGDAYSSTRARRCLRDGDPEGAALVLGRLFEIEGRVARGDERGRTIGYPTANVHLGEFVCPALGVYAVKAGIDKGVGTVWHSAVANLGRRPTFGGEGIVLEAHLFDFDGDLYGRHLRVALVEYLRPEKKFDGIDELKAQIADDSSRARQILADA